jgi:cytochrome oxidase Cu insertion factor (SCO1/SenC/PrrC family)
MRKYDNQAQPEKGSAPIRLANEANASSSAQARRKEKVLAGDLIPDFTLLNQSGASVSLSDFLGKKHIVLYFYPKDNWTPVNTGV